MDLQQLFLICGGSLFGILTLIEITPIKINPWKTIARFLGDAFNGSLITKINSLEEQISSLEKQIGALSEEQVNIRHKIDRHVAEGKRKAIIQFERQLLDEGDKVTKDAFDTILIDITEYEEYCERHPEFKNNVVINGIYFINKTYQKKLIDNSFYVPILEEK